MLANFNKAHILVIGDILLDRYWHGATNRLSPEAPVPVVNINQIEDRPGGASNVAMNAASIGAQVTLMGIVGNDIEGRTLEEKINAHAIKTKLVKSSTHPTITKLRLLSRHQQLVRMDFEKIFDNLKDRSDLVELYLNEIASANAVTVSDYHKGSIADASIIINKARELKIPVFIDPKGASFDHYRGATMLTPNLKEFEIVVGACTSNEMIEEKALKAIAQYDLQSILITRGADGMTLVERGKKAIHLKARAYDVKDVTGAGDTVIATLATCVATGSSFAEAIHIANAAAGVTVTKLGTATISYTELRQALRETNESILGILTEQEAIKMRQEANAAGEKVVMTNGCFDILHPGHIGYLEAAKAAGDRLLVAVNTDESVRKIKGPGRPIKSTEQRMKILAAFRAVDWVVSFEEETPERLIKAITPDVLVKGVDYKIEDIVGADHVIAHGGEVKIVGPEKAWSSTEMIKKITGEIE